MSLSTQYSAEIQESTGCVRRIEKVTRSHMCRIEGYSVDKNIGKGNSLESTIFDVGGYDWSVKYYPNGSLEAEVDDISIYLYHKNKSEVFPMEPTPHIVVPPGNIQQQLGPLLENGNGMDVTFKVDGQNFNAHKCILAARSPVFSAQFFGPMKEKSDTIKIEEMEAPVFKALLHFIYNDTFPEFEERKESVEKHDTKLMAQYLLVAADRYGLERLKIICEKMLCSSIDTSNAVSLLSIAERHSCNHLKETCLKFLASPGVLQEVIETEQFLIGSLPSNLKESSVK
ncbi:BTB/POZ and MATH domain-containing protein 1-like [Carex rostrata]